METGFNQHRNHHYHLHTKQVRRTTLADANERRDPIVFEELTRALMAQAGNAIRKERRELLYLIDSTTIGLHGRGNEWTQASATRTRGLKVHLQLEGTSLAPVHHTITPANVNDSSEGSKIEPQCGATYVFDKGYCDYGWWHRFTEAGARFVTRLKKNAAYGVQSVNAVPIEADNIASDTVIRLTHKSNRAGHKNTCTEALRRIEVLRPDDAPLVLVTNDLQAPAVEIAQLYKQRWTIELFFKWIKQHLKIKTFLGESENAVRIQLLTALIAYLLVVIHKAAGALKESLWELLTELRTGLFLRVQEEQDRWRRRRHRQAVFDARQRGLFA